MSRSATRLPPTSRTSRSSPRPRSTRNGNNLANRLNGNDAANTLAGHGDNDSLYGGGGLDTLFGNNGDDVLMGGAGSDTLMGGSGADSFMLLSVSDSPYVGYDNISDFSVSEGDRIDLSWIDANANMSGNQAFLFNNAGIFSGAIGEVIFNNGFVMGDVDGGGGADFRIAVNAPALASSAFIL